MDPVRQYNSPSLGVGNNPISRIDLDEGFDTWIGAYLYTLLNGGGDFCQNDNGSFTVGESYFDAECNCNGLSITTGSGWERNVSGLYNIFNDSDHTSAQFSADPSIPTVMQTDFSFSAFHQSVNRPVRPSDYPFKASAAVRSADTRAHRSNGRTDAAINIEFASGKSQVLNLAYVEPQGPKIFYECFSNC